MQRYAIERATAARGDTIVEWYSERVSAKTMERPELDRLRADARAGRVRGAYVYKFDRVVRTGVRDLLNIVEELKACGLERARSTTELPARAHASRPKEASGDGQSAWTSAAEGAVRRLRAEGRSLRAIAMALKIPLATVARAARSTV